MIPADQVALLAEFYAQFARPPRIDEASRALGKERFYSLLRELHQQHAPASDFELFRQLAVDACKDWWRANSQPSSLPPRA